MNLKKSKKNLGVLLAAMFVMNMIFGCTSIAYAAGTTASTTVNGSISASIISVSVPASLARNMATSQIEKMTEPSEMTQTIH